MELTQFLNSKWNNQNLPNFQGVISTYGRASSSICFLKKTKYKKLLLVKLLGNAACSPFQLAELDSLEVNGWLRVIRTHGLLFSLRNCFKRLNYKKLLLSKLPIFTNLNNILLTLAKTGCSEVVFFANLCTAPLGLTDRTPTRPYFEIPSSFEHWICRHYARPIKNARTSSKQVFSGQDPSYGTHCNSELTIRAIRREYFNYKCET